MKRKKVIFMLFLFIVAMTLAGCKKSGETYDFADMEPKSIDPWVYIQDTSISASGTIRNFASSAGNLGVTVGVMGIVFSLLYMAIRILFSSSPKTRNEIKEEVIMKGLIAIMIFNVPLWLGVFKMFGDLLI